jgi:hypothetical protein
MWIVPNEKRWRSLALHLEEIEIAGAAARALSGLLVLYTAAREDDLLEDDQVAIRYAN